MEPVFMATISGYPCGNPTRYVVRRWRLRGTTLAPDPCVIVVETLEEARAHLPRDMCFRVGESKKAGPALVETWL